MGTDKNIKLHIVTDIKGDHNSNQRYSDTIDMSLTLVRRVINATTLRPLQTIISSRKYADAPDGQLSLTFGSPRMAFFADEPVSQVDVPSGSGNFSILPLHVPIIAVLRPGCMTVFKDGSAQILAEEASPLYNFDIDSARKTADAAKQALAAASDDMGKAMAQIEIDTCEAIIEA